MPMAVDAEAIICIIKILKKGLKSPRSYTQTTYE